PNQRLEQWREGENILIAEYWVKEKTKKRLALFADGAVRNVTDIPELELAAMEPVRFREVEADKIVQYLISGVEVLEGPDEWPGQFIPIVPVVGEEVHVGRETVTHGLVRFAKDAQRAYNFARTAATESVSLAPKAPYIGTVAMFAGHETAWHQSNRKNKAFLPYNPDENAPGAKPERQTAPEIQLAYAQEASISQQDMSSTTGIYPPALGKQSNEVSGVAIDRRDKMGDVGTFVYTDNLGIAISYAGRILVDLIPRIYDSTRVVRILGEDETENFVTINEPVLNENEEVVLLNDLSVGRYDVRVVPGPSFSTKREEAATSMVDFIRAAPQTASMVMDLLAKNLDWPGAEEMADRFRKIAVARGLAEPEEGEERPEPDPETLAEAQKLQIEALEGENKALKLQAETQKITAETSGIELDNVAKALEVAFETEAFQEAVSAAVGNVLADITARSNGAI
ncbi:MAG: portal protein, partial [Geminicoccaceae bacterium]